MKEKIIAVTLRDNQGWQKRLWFVDASREEITRLLWISKKLAKSGALLEEITRETRQMAKKMGLQEIAH